MTQYNKSTNVLLQTLLLFILLFATLIITPTTLAADASLKFYPETINTTVGTTFKTTIMVDTSGYSTGGVGAIIIYNPNMIAAESIETGEIFADYPITSINNTIGKVYVSGISSSKNSLFIGTGSFATVTFKSIQTGTTKLNFDHELGSTTDSNIAVTFGSGDVLNSVNSLTVNIEDSGDYAKTSDSNVFKIVDSVKSISLKDSVSKLLSSLKLPFLNNSLASTRSGRTASAKLEPLDPITHQKPITDPDTAQPIAEINSASPANNFILPILILIIITVSIAIIVLYKKL